MRTSTTNSTAIHTEFTIIHSTTSFVISEQQAVGFVFFCGNKQVYFSHLFHNQWQERPAVADKPRRHACETFARFM